MLLEFQRDLAAAISTPVDGPLRVYRNTVLNGCVEALRDNYPVVARLLGDEMFDRIAADHAAQCPPRQPVLALYGSGFAEWMEEQPWIDELGYVADVARIERLHIESLFAADAGPLKLCSLAGGTDWNALELPLHPAARFDWFTTPAMSIWLAHRQAEIGELTFDWHAEGALFTRPSLEVQPVSIDRAAHRFLFAIRQGESVGAAAIATAELYPDTDMGPLFAFLVNAGVFAAPSSRSLP